MCCRMHDAGHLEQPASAAIVSHCRCLPFNHHDDTGSYQQTSGCKPDLAWLSGMGTAPATPKLPVGYSDGQDHEQRPHEGLPVWALYRSTASKCTAEQRCHMGCHPHCHSCGSVAPKKHRLVTTADLRQDRCQVKPLSATYSLRPQQHIHCPC